MVAVLPDGLIKSFTRTPRAVAAVSQSPFTGQGQVHDWGQGWWEYELTFARQSEADGRALSGFLTGLRGAALPFLFKDPSIVQSVTGSPLVAGAGQSGYALASDGWPSSATVMRAGEFFQLGTGLDCRLYQLTADAVSDGSGAATLAIWPALRFSPADNAALIVSAPAVLLRLTQAAPVLVERPVKYSFTISAREAL